jgi:16S rRNA (cytidine1402-2'-O)-methyltransferase
VAVARELTKLHEDVWRGTLAGAAERIAGELPRGEHVLVIAGAPERPAPTSDDIAAALRAAAAEGLDRKTAVAEVARSLGVPRRVVYDASLPRASD